MDRSKSPIVIKLDDESIQQNLFFFRSNFKIGRDETCDIVINHGIVSRVHLEIFFDNGWKIKDNNSTNGTFINGTPIRSVTALEKGGKLVLGKDGPVIYWEIQYFQSKTTTQPRPGGTGAISTQTAIAEADSAASDFTDVTNSTTSFSTADSPSAKKQPSESSVPPKKTPPEAPVSMDDDDTMEKEAADFAINPQTEEDEEHTKEKALPGVVPGQPSEDSRKLSREEIARRYLEDDSEDVGEHTRIIRQAFREQQEKER